MSRAPRLRLCSMISNRLNIIFPYLTFQLYALKMVCTAGVWFSDIRRVQRFNAIHSVNHFWLSVFVRAARRGNCLLFLRQQRLNGRELLTVGVEIDNKSHSCRQTHAISIGSYSYFKFNTDGTSRWSLHLKQQRNHSHRCRSATVDDDSWLYRMIKRCYVIKVPDTRRCSMCLACYLDDCGHDHCV